MKIQRRLKARSRQFAVDARKSRSTKRRLKETVRTGGDRCGLTCGNRVVFRKHFGHASEAALEYPQHIDVKRRYTKPNRPQQRLSGGWEPFHFAIKAINGSVQRIR